MDVGFKSFVSENEIEAKRQLRQQQWEQTRKPDEPLEAPEEEFDSRTLFERLKEQRDRKQEEFEESRKLKHLIRGLDNEEVTFLEQVDANKLMEEEHKQKEEEDAIREYQSRITNLNEEEQTKKIEAFKKSLFSSPGSSSKSAANIVKSSNRSSNRNKQANLLVKAVKIKKDNSKEDQTSKEGERSSQLGKRKRDDDDDGERQDDNREKKQRDSDDEEEQPESEVLGPAYKSLGVLPGIASYCSDTSDSDNADSEDSTDEVNSNELNPYFSNLEGRRILKNVKKVNKMKKSCQ